MPARLRAQNAEAVLRIVERDALDEARQHFLGRRCHLWFHTDRSVINSSGLGPFQRERDEQNIVNAILKEVVAAQLREPSCARRGQESQLSRHERRWRARSPAVGSM